LWQNISFSEKCVAFWRRKKREKDRRAGMEVGECKQLCKRGRRQKLWEEEKDLRKKGILSLIVVFSASPGLLRNLLSSDDLLRLPSTPSSLPLARPPPAPIVCIIHRSPPVVFDQGWHHRRLSCLCVVITYGCCDCATTTNTALLRGLWSCAGSCMHEWHFLRLLLSLSLSHRISAAAAPITTYHLPGWTPATSEFQARFSPQIPPSSTPPPPPPVSKP